MRPILIVAAIAVVAAGGVTIAQAAAALTTTQTRAATAPAGTYKLDPNHTSVVARLAHSGGTSFSTFRFAKVSGTLDINPASPSGAKLSVTVDPASIMTPVGADFIAEITSDRMLNTPKFPTATFTSTSVAVNGGDAVINGDLNFMGVTKSEVINASLVGGGPGQRGNTLGFTGTMKFKRSDFGFTGLAGAIGDDVTLELDSEFDG